MITLGGGVLGITLLGSVSSVLESCSNPVDSVDLGAGSDAGKSITVDVSALTTDNTAVHTTSPTGRPLLIIRRNGTYECILLICTHQGCQYPDIDLRSNAITCACHGSTYDLDGHVTGGPSTTNLTTFATTFDAATKKVTVKF